MIKDRVLHNPLNGRFTNSWAVKRPSVSYEDAKPQKASNYWSSSEYSQNNAWNVNFNNGNVNNNNKYNTNNIARGVAALDGLKQYSFSHLPREAQESKDFIEFFKGVVFAYHDCMRGKKSSPQAMAYMQIARYDLPSLAWELFTNTYKPTTSTCFLVKYPKLREVFAANFRDRIVHHWIILRLEHLFEHRFVSQGNVSFNCRKGFGTDKCVLHCASGMKRVTRNYRKKAWIFRGDLVGFFMSIDKNMLWYLLERFIKRWCFNAEKYGFEKYSLSDMPIIYWKQLMYATKTTVMHHPEEDCILNSDVTLWLGLALNKSLFGCGKDKGEPIGNLTTQQFANFLMSFFDSFVLWLFRGKNFCYARFVDDWVIICDDLQFIKSAIPRMEAYLQKLKLTMHKDKRYLQPTSHGVMFVGSFIKPNRIYLSNRTLARFEERAVGFGRLASKKDFLNVLDCNRIEQVINSYLGFCKGKRTYKRKKEIFLKFGDDFWKYFYIRGDYESIRTKAEYRSLKPKLELW